MSRTILLTGAGGFVGQGLRLSLDHGGFVTRSVLRGPSRGPTDIVTGDLSAFSRWDEVVGGVDAIVHLAARAHVRATGAAAQVEAFRPVNLQVTMNLAEAAVAQRVRRFVFVSSIGVNGNETHGRPFNEADVPDPVDPYAVSKWEAEQSLIRRLKGTATELVIVRPTLVYGPDVRGNLLRLMRLVDSGMPVPLGGLRAPRSFVGRDNLCDLLIECLDHPRAAGEIFVVAEPERRSTASFVRAIAQRLGRSSRVWAWPTPVIRAAAAIAGRGADLAKLAGALEVDPSKAMTLLGWRPRIDFSAGIAGMVDSYVRKKGAHVA